MKKSAQVNVSEVEELDENPFDFNEEADE